ncbi:MAG TPA: protein kinase, partial [Pirellulales bacterium]
MGVVFLARQTSIDRTIAIKMLKPEGAHDDEVRARFLSEAAVTGALDHPNIVPIHDLGSNEQGALFYSMKRVNGTPWCDVLLTRSTDENLETWMRMADALAFAHSRGIIHRDIKPENVMLGDYGEVLVMDWGLAMSVVEQGRAAYYDAGDSMAGTPAYMAPEMASGSVDQLSFTSDVYLCGAVLFEIVAGFPPHTGKNVMGCLYAAASNQIRRTDKEGELLDIALKAMETNPKERYQSVTELQAAVKSFQSHSESLVLSTKAKESLERAAGTNDYNDFAEALFGFREALTLWSGNEAAEVGVVKAAVAYARSAFDKGDLDLATSLLDAKIVDHQPLLVLIEEEIRAREARQRSYQRITKAATALVVAVFVIIVVALFWINSSRQQAEDARKKAVSAAEAAVRAQTEAEAERVKAEEQKKKADEQTVVAETQKKLALEAKTQAEGDRAAAVQAKTVAENATAEAKRAQREVSVRAYLAQMGLTDAKVRENSFGIARYLLAKTEYDYRGWEFGWLRHLCGMARTTYVGHTRPLSSAAVTRDGRLVTASEDKTLRMWEAASGKLLHVWNLPAPATAVDVSRDGRWAAVGLRSGQTFVYSLSELQAEPRFFTKDERRPILSVTFADRKSTGELFVGTANDKRAVLMYRIPVAPAGIANRTGATSVSFQAQGPRPAAGEDPAAPAADPRVLAVSHYYQNISDAVTCLRYHYETQRLVTAARDGGVWFWDPWVSATPSALKQFDLKNSSAFAVAFSKDGGRIAAVGSDGMVHIWDVNAPAAEDKSFPEAITFEAHPMAILTVDFAPNGTDLLTAGEDNTIRIWHVGATAESVERRAVLRGHAGWVRSAVFDPGSEQPIVYSASQDAEAKAWNVDEYHETVPLSGHTADGVLSGAFSPDGTTAVTGGADSTVRWWDVKLGDQRGLFEEGHNLETTGAAVDRTGRYAVTTCVDGWTAIWDLSINAEARRFRVHQGPATCAAFGPKSDWIATGGGDETVRLTARETGEQIRVSAKLGSAVRSLAVAPDGKLIAAGMTNGKIRLLNAETLREVRVLEGHSRDVNSLCFSPDGSEIYAASNDTTSGCWRVADGQERAPPLKHAQPVYVVTVSPNGKYVATGDFAGRVRLWDAGTRKLIADFSEDFSSPTASVRTGHKSEVHALAFSGDGLQLASGDNNDGEVIVWDVKRFVEAPYARPTGYHASGHVAAYNDGGSTQTTSFVADRWLAAPTSIVYLDYLPGTSLVFAASKYDITVSDVADKRPNRIPTAAISAHLQVVGVAFHPSGKFVVSAGLESVAKIWSLDSQKVVRKLYGVHRVKMTSLDVSRDGRFVATGGEDGLAVVWDFETGKPLKLLGPAGEGVRAVKFSPDGSLVATAA